MQYNETTALEVIAKFNLKPNTNRVWRLRGAIPDCYFNESYNKPEPKTEQDTSKILTFLNLPFVKKTYFDKYLGYSGATVGFCNSEIQITQPQFDAVQNKINMFISLWKQTINAGSAKLLRAFLSKPFVKPYVLLKSDIDKKEIKKLVYRLNSEKKPENLHVAFERLKIEYEVIM